LTLSAAPAAAVPNALAATHSPAKNQVDFFIFSSVVRLTSAPDEMPRDYRTALSAAGMFSNFLRPR
jgi:hypothetical protein